MKKDEKMSLIDLSVPELQKRLQSLQKELMIARLAVRAGKEPNTAKPAKLGKSIAIVKTALRNKQNFPDVVKLQSGVKA